MGGLIPKDIRVEAQAAAEAYTRRDDFRMPEPEPLYRVTLELRPCDAQGTELRGLGYVVFEGVARAWQDHEGDTPEVLFFGEDPAWIDATERRPVMRLDWRAVPGGATEYVARTYGPA